MTGREPALVEVALPTGVFGTFTYSVPAELRSDIRAGMRVEVPWATRVSTGFVVGFPETSELDPKKIRDIRAILDDEEPAILPQILKLCRWAADYYIAPLGEMIRIALPANMSARGNRRVRTVLSADEIANAISEARVSPADEVTLEAIGRGQTDVRDLTRRVRGARNSLQRLSRAGIIRIEDILQDRAGVRYDRFAVLRETPGDLTTKQKEIVDLLRDRGGDALVDLIRSAKMSESALGTLVRRGVLTIERRPRHHSLEAFVADLDHVRVGELRHSDEQREAISRIKPGFGKFAPFLLEGVTGSGKTEVYIELMREAVRRGEQAILLVPEIALTPVFAARLKERFGDRIAILHSNLSPGERHDQWTRARNALVDVAIGPRSALFTPFRNLGLIVVDEEGDAAYKQEESPRYNARDLAVVRAHLERIPVVLGSATPSLESRDNAANGKYELIRLSKRVESRPLPAVEIVDIRKEKGEPGDHGFVLFGTRVKEEIRAVVAAGEQAIVLMNRRGYAPFLLCRECEHEFRCRDCSVNLTVHRRAAKLMCHYCGFRSPIPASCPVCAGEVLQPIGFGTEKVEERFREVFPDIVVDVLDRDRARKKGELVRILQRFRSGETQVLIGTQMISKGHDFPKVTLTAVLNADTILGYPDFRSAEKTFYLLTQVAGRAGRGELPGRVLIQTGFPTHYAIQHAARHDYEAFFEEEIDFRRRAHYPPATSMVAIVIRGEDERVVERVAAALGADLHESTRHIADIRIQGPAPAPLARIKGVFRYHILLRSMHRKPLRNAIEAAVVRRDLKPPDVIIDVDPLNML